MVACYKKRITFILCACALVWVLSAQALVVDTAQLFSDDQIANFTERLQKIADKAGTQASILTVRSLDGKDAQSFADDYFDENRYGLGPDCEGILLLISTGDGTPNSGNMHISTCGPKTIAKITDYKIESLLDTLYDKGLKDRDYVRAVDAYITDLSGKLYNEITSKDTGIGICGGLVTFLLSIFGIKRKNKVKAASLYFDNDTNSIANFRPFKDAVISSHVTTRVISRNDNDSGSSGGSTTHTSSSGQTHGGGGRSF